MRWWVLMIALFCSLQPGWAGSSPLSMEEIAPGVFVHQGAHEEFGDHYHGDIANIGFIIGDEAVAVIDSGGSYLVGVALRDAIRARTQKPIRYVINTHVHSDHIFGNAAFEQDNVEFIGHVQLPRAMRSRAEDYEANLRTMLGDAAAAGSRIVVSTHTVAAERFIELGNRRLLLKAWPIAHTDHDLSVMDELTGSWWLGDLLFVDRTPSIDGDIRGWLTVMDAMSHVSATRLIPGHGPVVTDKNAALAKQRQYLQVLLSDLTKSIAEGKSMQAAIASAAQSERSQWMLFDTTNRRNATMLYPKLEWD
ncbi:MAG: quinoprotein relay system zinc metallohydrolase 2 [Oxalobacteraceae bacterium]|nr:quinoprotein relay system zinc metallohydrolase 2 [Oxalobacteraceae bacterium]